MFDLSEPLLNAFRDELRKQAGLADVVAKNAPRLKNIGSLGGAGAAVGGLLGAGIGAVRGARDAHQEGRSVALGALSGAGRGGLSGAGAGALLGGAAGAAGGGALNPSWLAQKGGVVGAGSRFGQRQVHALTGVLSPKELEGVRGGAYNARQASNASAKNLTDLWNAGAPEGDIHGAVNKAIKSEHGLMAAENAQQMWLTSLPGYVGAVRREGLGKVLSTSAKEQWHNSHPALTALTVGVPLASAAGTLASPESADGKGRGEQLGENVGNAVGGVVGGAMPIVGNVMAGETLKRVGGAVGQGIDRLRGRSGKPRLVPASTHTLGPPPLEAAESQNTPTERVMSPSMAGLPPEGL